MTWITDTIAGRTIIILVLGLGSILALAHYLYQAGIEREISARNVGAFVERLLVLTDTIMSIDPDRRDDAAHRLSGGPLELHWGREPLAIPGGKLDAGAKRLRDALMSRSAQLRAKGLVIGSSRTAASAHAAAKPLDERHTTLLSLPLADGSWLNVTLARVEATRVTAPSVLLSATLAALGVILVAVLMSRWLTRPLRNLAEGARHQFRAPGDARFPEAGTREVRLLATALNELQDRIGRMMDERTHTLAAVSHDLRTPLTRLRLRLASVPEGDFRRTAEADLDEMESMIDATLSFLREDVAKEPIEQVDIMAIVETIVADATDAGMKVVVDGPRQMVVSGRHLALKRAMTNLVQNALKYGGQASVHASGNGDRVVISIEDEGPGILPNELETVFEPFYRGEPSRAKSTGGHGLGLTVARMILRSHGGDVKLANRSPKGLQARVTLPAAPAV